MNKEIKEKWVKALRSGEYKQGNGALRDHNGGFCCLGVLCDIYSKDKNVQFTELEKQDGYYLSQEVREWSDIDKASPYLTSGSLAYLNDKGIPFNQIADQIEKEL